MKSKLLASAVLTLLTVAGLCRADDPPIPPMPQPATEHAWLKNLVGDWDSECEIFMEPGKPPVKAKSTESARMLGGFWVLTDGKGEIMGMRHASLGIEGVQFHPESILTTVGKDLLRNFLKL